MDMVVILALALVACAGAGGSRCRSARVGVAEKPPALRDLPPPVQALRMVERAHGLLLPSAAWEVEQAAHRAGH